MTYEDLLVVPWVDKGRTLEGLDCYGIVLELCKRAGTPLKNICDEGVIEEKELSRYVESLNVEERDHPEKGFLIQCVYEGRLHMGYLVDKKMVVHMTVNGARVTPVIAFRGVKYFEVINERS